MMQVGIEIEGVFNFPYVENIPLGDYHRGEPVGSYWETQRDSSIQKTREFKSEQAIEFVSNVLETNKEWTKAIEEFRGFFPKDKELFEIAYFNGTTGCHFHFSFPKGETVYTKALFEHYIELRKLFFKKIKDSKTLSNKVKNGILRKYFRDYAEELSKDAYVNILLSGSQERRSEFNLRSDMRGRGLEWRSINLNGVSTWNELYEVLGIAYACVQDFKKILTKEVTEQKKFKFKDTAKKSSTTKVFKVVKTRCVT